jgi:outer membrane protein TolC
MASQVNSAARRQELIAAHGELDLAWAELGAAMGVPDLQPVALQPIQAKAFPESSLQEELALATKARSDLAALGHARDAQAQAVSAARSDFGPRVSAYGNWQEDRGSLTSSGGNNWVAGVQISLDLLPLGKRDQLARESAARTRAEAQLAQAQLDTRLQVSRAHIQRQTAQLSIETAHSAVDQATESLRIVKNRYAAGLATITELLRAEDAERQAQSMYWKAVYGNAMAYAQLLYAQGALTPDAAEVLQ